MPNPRAPGLGARHPVYVFTRAGVRDVDRAAALEFGIPSIVLMENAARHVTDVALDGLEGSPRPRALVICGPGNNGGDGLAAARHLHNAGLRVTCFLGARADAYSGDARTNLETVQRMGLRTVTMDSADPGGSLMAVAAGMGKGDVLVDALFGTGLARDLDSPYEKLIAEINGLGADGVPVLAVDIPSGLDADSGRARRVAVRASVTVTFVGLKEGFFALEAQPFLGEVVVADIGAPRELLERLGRRLTPPGPDEPADEPPPAPARRGK